MLPRALLQPSFRPSQPCRPWAFSPPSRSSRPSRPFLPSAAWSTSAAAPSSSAPAPSPSPCLPAGGTARPARLRPDLSARAGAGVRQTPCAPSRGSEAQRNLRLVTFLEELGQLAQLDLVIALVRARAEL